MLVLRSQLHRVLTASLFGLLVVIASGCGGPQGPRVRFATASEAQLRAVENERVVWYEFKAGDEVPMNFILVGVAEGGAKGIPVVAKRPFFIVIRQGAAPAFSFDGESIAYHDSGEAFLALTRHDGKNQISLISYVGKAVDMPAELKDLKQP